MTPYVPCHANPDVVGFGTKELHVGDHVFEPHRTKTLPADEVEELEEYRDAIGRPFVLRGPAPGGSPGAASDPLAAGIHGNRRGRMYIAAGNWWIKRVGSRVVLIAYPGIVARRGNRVEVAG